MSYDPLQTHVTKQLDIMGMPKWHFADGQTVHVDYGGIVCEGVIRGKSGGGLLDGQGSPWLEHLDNPEVQPQGS